MRNYLRCFSVLLALLLCLCAAVPALASAADTGSTAALTLRYEIDGQPAADVSFAIYRVGDNAGGMQFAWTEEYAAYHLTLDLSSAADLAETLASYIARDGNEAYRIAETDSEGAAAFDSLPDGLYCVIGAATASGDYRYSPIPTLVFFPYTDENGYASRDADIVIKHETAMQNGDGGSTVSGETVSRKAVKVWEDGNAEDRPDDITVQLLRDGGVYEEAVLSEANGWRVVWSGLSGRYDWSVVEKEVPEGYSSSTERSSGTYIITNQKDQSVAPTPEPAPEPEPTPEPEPEPSGPSKPVLPQTGQNWMLIMTMSCMGILCIICGLLSRKCGRHTVRCLGIALFIAGALFILGALLLTGANIRKDRSAGEAAEATCEVVESETEKRQETLREVQTEPDYRIDPELPMPVCEINGRAYIGTVNIPAIGKTLAVMDEWSYDGLKISPGRYQGSVYTNDMIICGHNYQSHFGQLGSLVIGDEVFFTDMDGNIFRYTVSAVETLEKTDIEGMSAGNWDLTLFTCTVGGRQRIAVRCMLRAENT